MLWVLVLLGCGELYVDTGWDAPGLTRESSDEVEMTPAVRLPLDPSPTTWIQVELLVSAQADAAPGASSHHVGTGTLDGTASGVSLEALLAEGDFAFEVEVHDDHGAHHDLLFVFDRVGTADWMWTAVVDGAEVDLGGGAGDPGFALEVMCGTLTVDGDGQISTEASTPSSTSWRWLDCAVVGSDLELLLRMADGPSRLVDVDTDGHSGIGGVRGSWATVVDVERDLHQPAQPSPCGATWTHPTSSSRRLPR